MLGISSRAVRMPASPIRKLVPFSDAAKARGVKVYHLNIGQPDVESPPLFWDAIRRVDLKVLEYSHSAGLLPLREKVAAKYVEAGIQVRADQVMVTTAGSEAISFAMGVICDPGDEVVIPEPMYANYLGFAAAIGVNVVPVMSGIEEGFALPSASAFGENIGPRTKAILINNPGNPTGVVYSDSQLEALAGLARKHNLYILADEVYREFSYLSHPPTSVLQLPGLDEHTVMIDSVSKRFSLCGARIGFLVSRNKRFMDAALKFAQARLAPPTLEMLGVLGALDTPASYFDGVREAYRRRRDVVVSRVSAIKGAVVPQIDGAFYAMVRLPIDDADRFCQWLLESFEHKGATVMFAPGSGFYGTPGAGLDEVRIAYVLNEADLHAAMDCLEAALAVYPGSKIAATSG